MVHLIIGAQWGDEGKGKIVDLLSQKADCVIRFHGGNNAGHTIINSCGKFPLHLVPAGIFNQKCQVFITNGVILDLGVLIKEIEMIERVLPDLSDRLFISPRAHVIMPYHKILDRLFEDAKGKAKTGTTGRGIGPTYADKVSYNGIRLFDFINPQMFKKKLEMILLLKNKMITAFGEKPLKLDEVYQEEFKKFAEQKKECSCRKNSIKDNLEKWEKMLNKNGFSEGEAVLRFKSNMQNPNPAMRDFPLARINLHEHPLQKNKYRVWPLMNLSVATDDIELKITHIVRGKDHADNAKRQEMIYKVLGLEKKFPWTFFMGKIKFTDIVLSKRKLNVAIKEGKYSGAEDVRLPTIVSLKKRGYKPEAFSKFAEQRGLTDVDKVISQEDFFEVIDTFSKN